MPVPKDTSISKGYLRPADGIIKLADIPGKDRGGYNYKGVHYRVTGTSLVTIDHNGVVAAVGTIPGTDQVQFSESFDYLSIGGDQKLYLYDGTTLAQVTDPDLGVVIDHLWADGYFMTTDGANLVVTETNDSFAVNPLKYGSAETDPDNIKSLLRHRREIYALNRNTIEVFRNVGGSYFPFQVSSSAQINGGVVGTHACCLFQDAIAFLGGKRNEPCAVHMGINGQSVKVSTREIDTILQDYTEAQLENVLVESRVEKSHALLYVHLPDRTLVYDHAASKAVGAYVWFDLTSSVVGLGQYRAKNFVWCYDKWNCGDTLLNQTGYFTSTESAHYGDVIGWEFHTSIVYNKGGAIFHELELVALTGRTKLGIDPVIWASYTLDGTFYSMEQSISAGRQGDRSIKLAWYQQGLMGDTRAQKFRGTSDAHISVSRLEARLEALNG